MLRKYSLFLLLSSMVLITLNVEASLISGIQMRDSRGNSDTTSSPGILQFTQPHYRVNENVSQVNLTISRTEGSYGAVAVNYTTQDGSATANHDYITTQQVLNWDADETSSKNINVPILLDNVVETDENFTVILSNPTNNALLGSSTIATVIITDSMGHPTTADTIVEAAPPLFPGTLQFTTDYYEVPENGGSISVTITRTGGSDGLVEVTYSTQDDTAKSQDYIAVQDTLRWLDGESESKRIKVSIYDDALVEENESFFMKLSNPTNGATLGNITEAIVAITDNDLVTTLQFSSSVYTVNEDEKMATITVQREGGKIGQVSVDYETIDITATAGEDYTAAKGILVWVNGDTSDRTFSISLKDDNVLEDNKTVQLKLSNITGDAFLGTPIEATLTIIENETGECQSSTIIDCVWDNNGQTLQDVKITPLGIVIGGQLVGKIENEGKVQNVTLLANTYLTGGTERGIVQGKIKGKDPENLPIINYVEITADSTLTNVIMGRNAYINSGVVLKQGVWFESNSVIPYMTDLNTVLGTFSTPYLEIDAINVTRDILLNSGKYGIVGAINGLLELTNLALGLRQNPDNGYLVLDVTPFHYRVLPVQVRQIWGKQTIENKQLTPMGISTSPLGEVTFITHTGREITTLPVVQNPQALQAALAIFGLNQMSMQSSGNLKIPTLNGQYYMVRPDLWSMDMPTHKLVGIRGTNSSWLSNLVEVFLLFEGATGNVRQQLLYPAAANPQALYDAQSGTDESQTVLYLDGRAYVFTDKGVYKGLFDYLVTPGSPPFARKLQILDIEDINADGLTDYRIIYPNGDNQMMYQCASCLE